MLIDRWQSAGLQWIPLRENVDNLCGLERESSCAKDMEGRGEKSRFGNSFARTRQLRTKERNGVLLTPN